MAFGGKMGIDGTKKMAEELQGSKVKIQTLNFETNVSNLPQEIKSVNKLLLEKGTSLIFVSIKKNKKNHVRELSKELFRTENFRNIKVAIFLDSTVDISDLADAVWRFSNNIDPKRDHLIIEAMDENDCSHLVLDGTRKTKEFDDFNRDWPNILVSDEQTIKRVDEIWDKLGLGKFIPSPSLKYRKQLYKGGAVAAE
jgi:4-hydroxy-3-polyprenylbenzoate decarboxylase